MLNLLQAYKKTDAKDRNSRKVAWGLSLLCFTIFLVICRPLLNSGDDAFIMYTFSGAFGGEPSVLVDLSNAWNIILSYPIVALFTNLPILNWYTFFLVLLHFASFFVITHSLVKRSGLFAGAILSIIYFLCFESMMLLSLTFTNTSMVCAIAVNLWLTGEKDIPSFSLKTAYKTPILLMLIAGLLRLYTLLFIELLFIPILIFTFKKRLSTLLFIKSGVLFIIMLLHYGHWIYNTRHVDGWSNNHERKEVQYKLANRPVDTLLLQQSINNITASQFFINNFHYDTASLPVNMMKQGIDHAIRKRTLDNHNDRQILYWAFVENRVYLFLIFCSGLVLWLLRDYRQLSYGLASFTFLTSVYFVLFIYFKTPVHLTHALLAVAWLSMRIPGLKGKSWMLMLLVPAAIWGSVRIYKMNARNLENYEKWICAYNAISKDSAAVHVATDGSFPIDYFNIYENPRDFRLTNFLSQPQFPLTLYRRRAEDLHVTKIDDFVNKHPDQSPHRILFVGETLHAIPYYLNEKNISIASIDSTDKECLMIYSLISKQLSP